MSLESSIEQAAPPPPPPGSGYPINLDVRYPEAGELNRFMIFVKWLLIIPHQLLLLPLLVGMWIATWFAWWAILFTGRYPRSLFDFVVGVQQWQLRATGYGYLYVTDQYPPFALDRPLRGAAIVALVLGVLFLLAFIGMYVLLFALLATMGSDFESTGGFPGATPGRGGFR
jgi:hypothetical protein